VREKVREVEQDGLLRLPRFGLIPNCAAYRMFQKRCIPDIPNWEADKSSGILFFA
jgi:hypothetical protein